MADKKKGWPIKDRAADMEKDQGINPNNSEYYKTMKRLRKAAKTKS